VRRGGPIGAEAPEDRQVVYDLVEAKERTYGAACAVGACSECWDIGCECECHDVPPPAREPVPGESYCWVCHQLVDLPF
jgi:hypothetical protein